MIASVPALVGAHSRELVKRARGQAVLMKLLQRHLKTAQLLGELADEIEVLLVHCETMSATARALQNTKTVIPIGMKHSDPTSQEV